MTQIKTIIALFISLFIVAPCSANLTTEYVADNVPIAIIRTSSQSGVDRSSSIIASINGHTLTVVFTENLGNVTIEVKDVYGDAVDLDLIGTPNGYECYIPLTGHYTVFFKLSNGDEYYGEFDVTN